MDERFMKVSYRKYQENVMQSDPCYKGLAGQIAAIGEGFELQWWNRSQLFGQILTVKN